MAEVGREGLHGALKVLLVAEAEQTRAAARAALTALGEPLEVTEARPGEEVRPTTPHSPDVVMVVVEGEESGALGSIQRLARAAPHAPVFAFLPEHDAALMRRALRAGADELLFPPLDGAGTLRALLKLGQAREAAASGRGGAVISVASVAGGVGVSTVSANLALALAYGLKKRVGLVDLDLQQGALSVLLDLERERTTMMPLVGPGKRLDSIQLEAALSRHCSGVYLLAAPSKMEDGLRHCDVPVGAVLDLMRRLFDFVVVDCGNRVDRNTVAGWERSNELLYVVDQGLRSARVARRFADLGKRLGVRGLKPLVVLNRFSSGHSTGEAHIVQALGAPIFFKFARDDAVLRRALLQGQNLWQLAPTPALKRGFEKFARLLAERAAGVRPEPSGWLRRGLLGALWAPA